MITFLVIALGIIALTAIVMYQSKLEAAEYEAQRDQMFSQYTEDIDFSLPIKGYDAVNDYDIAFTQWKADRAMS